MDTEIKQKADTRMQNAIEALKKDNSSIRTGRASLAILDHVHVDMYGSATPLNQAATLNIPEARMITIQPWDPKLIGDIERAIMKADLGINPVNDGKLIRLNIPPLTEERRKELVKQSKKRAEDAKVEIRNIRRDANDAFKKLEKSKELGEDQLKDKLDEMQKATDAHVKKIDEITAHKEEEIMEV